VAVDAVFLIQLLVSVLFSFLFFFISLYEGIFNPNEPNIARAIMCNIISLPFCILTIAMVLSYDGSPWSIAFQWGFYFMALMDFVLIILNGLAWFLAFKSSRRNPRMRRYGE